MLFSLLLALAVGSAARAACGGWASGSSFCAHYRDVVSVQLLARGLRAGYKGADVAYAVLYRSAEHTLLGNLSMVQEEDELLRAVHYRADDLAFEEVLTREHIVLRPPRPFAAAPNKTTGGRKMKHAPPAPPPERGNSTQAVEVAADVVLSAPLGLRISDPAVLDEIVKRYVGPGQGMSYVQDGVIHAPSPLDSSEAARHSTPVSPAEQLQVVTKQAVQHRRRRFMPQMPVPLVAVRLSLPSLDKLVVGGVLGSLALAVVYDTLTASRLLGGATELIRQTLHRRRGGGSVPNEDTVPVGAAAVAAAPAAWLRGRMLERLEGATQAVVQLVSPARGSAVRSRRRGAPAAAVSPMLDAVARTVMASLTPTRSLNFEDAGGDRPSPRLTPPSAASPLVSISLTVSRATSAQAAAAATALRQAAAAVSPVVSASVRGLGARLESLQRQAARLGQMVAISPMTTRAVGSPRQGLPDSSTTDAMFVLALIAEGRKQGPGPAGPGGRGRCGAGGAAGGRRHPPAPPHRCCPGAWLPSRY